MERTYILYNELSASYQRRWEAVLVLGQRLQPRDHAIDRHIFPLGDPLAPVNQSVPARFFCVGSRVARRNPLSRAPASKNGANSQVCLDGSGLTLGGTECRNVIFKNN